MDKLNMKRSSRLLVMLYSEWKKHENIKRPIKIEWNIMHMFSSSQLAKLYALKYKLNTELCSIIAILHDIAVVEGKFKSDHDSLAKKHVLGAINRYNNVYRKNLDPITDKEIEIILSAILVHSDKETFSDDLYVEMLKNVDSVDRYLYGIKTEEAYSTRTKSFLKDLNIL